MKAFLLLGVAVCWSTTVRAAPVDRVKNERVVAPEITLQAGETAAPGSSCPAAIEFSSDAHFATATTDRSATRQVRRGKVIFLQAAGGPVRAIGPASLRFVQIEIAADGDDFVWGHKGLVPDLLRLLENRDARVGDLHIAASASKPQHTHRDRVLVCLSGAQLRHLPPEGHDENSSNGTGDGLWRQGQTHIGKTSARPISGS